MIEEVLPFCWELTMLHNVSSMNCMILISLLLKSPDLLLSLMSWLMNHCKSSDCGTWWCSFGMLIRVGGCWVRKCGKVTYDSLLEDEQLISISHVSSCRTLWLLYFLLLCWPDRCWPLPQAFFRCFIINLSSNKVFLCYINVSQQMSLLKST